MAQQKKGEQGGIERGPPGPEAELRSFWENANLHNLLFISVNLSKRRQRVGPARIRMGGVTVSIPWGQFVLLHLTKTLYITYN